MKKPTFQQITETATEVGPKWTNKEVAQFHYFNPNGLYAQKKARDKMISDAVANGKTKSGMILAYGSFNDHHARSLAHLAMLKFVNGVRLRIALIGIKRDIEAADEQLRAVAACD